MSSRLPVVSGGEVEQALRRLGFELSRTRGSHRSYRHPDGRGTTVPVHRGRDIAPALLRTILREAEVAADEFLAALRS